MVAAGDTTWGNFKSSNSLNQTKVLRRMCLCSVAAFLPRWEQTCACVYLNLELFWWFIQYKHDKEMDRVRNLLRFFAYTGTPQDFSLPLRSEWLDNRSQSISSGVGTWNLRVNIMLMVIVSNLCFLSVGWREREAGPGWKWKTPESIVLDMFQFVGFTKWKMLHHNTQFTKCVGWHSKWILLLVLISPSVRAESKQKGKSIGVISNNRSEKQLLKAGCWDELSPEM